MLAQLDLSAERLVKETKNAPFHACSGNKPLGIKGSKDFLFLETAALTITNADFGIPNIFFTLSVTILQLLTKTVLF